MPDIFLSYNREDQARAKLFADGFERAGLEVWWDTTLHAGEAYDEVTEKALNEAKAVVVLWSARSVASRWVRAEATQADRNKTLVPAMIEPCNRPIMFELTHTAELSLWHGDPKDPAWLAFLSDVRKFVEKDAANSAPQVQTTSPKTSSLRTILRLPLVLGGIALAVVVLIVAVSVLSANQAAPPQHQRTAFFGFAAGDSDPAIVKLAAAATDETIQGISAIQIETVARTETLGTPPGQRLRQAEKLGALYALSGDVRSDGNRINVAMRLEDVPTRTTLWEENINGDVAETISFPVRVAAKATDVVSCLARFRASLQRDDRSLLPLMAKVCSELRRVDTDKIPAVRELARKAPQSAIIQASFAHAASLAYGLAPDATGRALLDDAEEALKRAEKLDPQGLYVHMARGYVAQAERVPLIRQRTILDLGLAIRPSTGTDVFPFSMLNFQYAAHLYSIGRTKDSELYIRASTGTDPYGPYKHALAARLLAERGKTSEAEQRFEQTFARLPTAQVWEMWLTSAIFFGAGDPDMILSSPPAIVSGDAAACWRDIAAGLKSKMEAARLQGAGRASQCAEDGLIQVASAIPPLASAGSRDDAFRLAGRLVPTSFLGETAVLFWPQTRAMRADPLFLPLVEKLGLMEYWRTTKSQPDVCETEDVSFCRELKAATKP